jgi:hypothetical protein
MRRRTPVSAVGLGVTVFLFVLVTQAWAAGGRSIASAPTMQLGQEQRNAVNGIEYWRVPLKVGDRLTIRFGAQPGASGGVGVCLHAPGVTDSTIGNQPCSVTQFNGSSSAASFDVTATRTGAWVMAVHYAYYGTSCVDDGKLDPLCDRTVSYSLTAYVKHQIALSVTAPNLVRLGSKVTLNGRVTGGAKGSVLVEGYVDNEWKTLSVGKLSRTGRFSLAFKPKVAGTLQVRVSYPEAPLYLGSARELAIRVA